MTAQPNLFEIEVLPLFEAHREDWLTQARAIAVLLGQGGAIVTVNDVRKRLPPPEGLDPRVMGAVFTRFRWERVGYEASSRATCHGRPIARFRLR